MDIEDEFEDHLAAHSVGELVPKCAHGSSLLLARSPDPILDLFTVPLLQAIASAEVFLEGMTESESHALIRSKISHDYDDEEITTLAANTRIRLPSVLIAVGDDIIVSKVGIEKSQLPVNDSSGGGSMRQITDEMEGEVNSDVVSKNLPPAHRRASERWRDDNAAVKAEDLISPTRRLRVSARTAADRTRRGGRYEMSLPTDRPRRSGRYETSLPTTDADGRIVGRGKPGDPDNAASAFLRTFTLDRQEVAPSPVDAEGQEIGDDYVLGKQIGFGGHSIVREATQVRAGNERKVAVKIVRTHILGVSEQENERIQVELDGEVELWRFLNHQHILPLEAFYKLDEASFFFMPLNIGGTLFDLVRMNRQGVDGALTKSYSYQLASALRYLHFVGIVHYNVNLENCLIHSASRDEPGLLRLCDFGSAKRMDFQKDDSSDISSPDIQTQPYETDSTFLGGSLEYAAPELLKNQEGKRVAVSPALDVWAYGVCVYSMIVGKRPFQNSFQPRAVMAILTGDWDRDQLAGKGGDESFELVNTCLEMDVTKRRSMNDVYNCTWFKDYTDTQGDDEDTGRGEI
jgi:serine/threonine protein kinase